MDFVISWPARIKDKGGIRTQFSSVIDIYPTILEAVGLQSPSVLNGVPQKPVEGFSMVYSFDDAKAKSVHRTQYFEMLGNRAIYNDGWVAATTPAILPWVVGATSVSGWKITGRSCTTSKRTSVRPTTSPRRNPRNFVSFRTSSSPEAGKYNVLPIDNSKVERFDVSLRPSLT